MQPNFVVMTPVYLTPANNRLGKFIECVESVQEQSSKNFIQVVVDDGSTLPDTKNVLKSFKKKYRKKFVYFQTKNQGLVKALIGLFKLSLDVAKEEDYLLRLNSDDLLPPGTLQSFSQLADNKPIPDVLCGTEIIFHQEWNRLERVTPPSFENNRRMWEHLVWHKPFPHLNLCWKKEFFKKYASKLSENIPYSEDWDQAVMTARGLLDSSGHYQATQDPTYLFRKEDSSLGWMQTMDLKGKIYSYNQILKKQISGFEYYFQSLRNIFRILRIRFGLLFPIIRRDRIMPPFSEIILPQSLDENTLKLIIKTRSK